MFSSGTSSIGNVLFPQQLKNLKQCVPGRKSNEIRMFLLQFGKGVICTAEFYVKNKTKNQWNSECFLFVRICYCLARGNMLNRLSCFIPSLEVPREPGLLSPDTRQPLAGNFATCKTIIRSTFKTEF